MAYEWAKVYLDLPRRPWLRRAVKLHGPGVAWVWTCCILEARRSDDRGRLVDGERSLDACDIADLASVTEEDAARFLGLLVDHKWLTLDGETYVVTAYDERQDETRTDRASRLHRERQAKYRASQASSVTRDGSRDVTGDGECDGARDARVTVRDALDRDEDRDADEDDNARETRSAVAPLPSSTAYTLTPTGAPSSRKAKREKQAADEPVVPEWVPVEAWEAFDASRRAGRYKATWNANARRAALRVLSKLRDDGNDPEEVLNRAVASGSAGLFPVPRKQGTNGNGYQRTADTTHVPRSPIVVAERTAKTERTAPPAEELAALMADLGGDRGN